MKALVLLAHGTEEMEAVITCDILARSGINVVKASVEHEKDHNLILHCANGMQIVADVRIEDVSEKLSEFSVIVLPGGSKGADTFCTVIINYYYCYLNNLRIVMFKMLLNISLKVNLLLQFVLPHWLFVKLKFSMVLVSLVIRALKVM